MNKIIKLGATIWALGQILGFIVIGCVISFYIIEFIINMIQLSGH